jgi:hypothetical protein
MRSVGRHLRRSVLPITLTAVALLLLATGGATDSETDASSIAQAHSSPVLRDAPIMKSDDRENTQHIRGYSRESVWVEPYDRRSARR